MNWTNYFAYILVIIILLLGIGIFLMISSRKFMGIVLGVALLFSAAIILLFSFSLSIADGTYTPDPFAYTLGISALLVAMLFVLVGISINRKARQLTGDTFIPYNLISDSFAVSDAVDESLDSSAEESVSIPVTEGITKEQ